MLQVVSFGKIERIESFASQYVKARKIDVWLPEGYNSSRKYNVVYMHDGQMLFDASTTHNNQSWGVAEVATGLFNEGKVQDFIVIGIWNTEETRYTEYFPQKPVEALNKEQKALVIQQLQETISTATDLKPSSDNYLKFLVQELKLFIDKKYAVYTEREHTFMIGSSMGGLVSMYAICEYPEVFGGAACLSTHWPGTFTLENNPIPNSFMRYMNDHLPDPQTHKLYFDCGDQTLDAMYTALQKKVDLLMKNKGFSEQNWMTRFYPGDEHTENAWKGRLHVPLEFLLGK